MTAHIILRLLCVLFYSIEKISAQNWHHDVCYFFSTMFKFFTFSTFIWRTKKNKKDVGAWEHVICQILCSCCCVYVSVHKPSECTSCSIINPCMICDEMFGWMSSLCCSIKEQCRNYCICAPHIYASIDHHLKNNGCVCFFLSRANHAFTMPKILCILFLCSIISMPFALNIH